MYTCISCYFSLFVVVFFWEGENRLDIMADTYYGWKKIKKSLSEKLVLKENR